MQGQRRTIDLYPDSIDFDPGSVSNTTNMNHQTSWNNILAPENQLPNFLISSSEPDCTFGNVSGHAVRTFSGWGSDEPSSSSNPPNQVIGDGSNTEDTWSPSFDVHGSAAQRCFESTNMLLFERGNRDSHVNVNTNDPFFRHNSSTDCLPQSENQSHNSRDTDAGVGYSTGKFRGSETEQNSPASLSFRNVGSSSGISGSSLDEKGGPASLGSWGSSCKRKALEGTSGSGQSYPGSSSSCFTQVQNNVYQAVLARHSASSSLSMSTPLGTSSTATTTTVEQSNPRDGFSMEEAMDEFPPLRVTENSESPFRSFNQRINSGNQQEPSTFTLSHGGSSRRSTFPGTFQIPTSRPLPHTESLDSRSAAASRSASRNLSSLINESGFSRNTHPLRGNGASFSRTGNSSSSINLSADRGLTLRDDPNLAGMSRNSSHANETRVPAQDPWNVTTGNTSSQIGASSSSHSFSPPWPSWIPHPNPPALNHQRLSGFSPWTLFPSVDSESGGPSGNLPPLSSGTSTSSQENSQGNRQAHPRSVFSLERQGDDVAGMPHSLRALAADIEGRHRLISEIRQVLSAMRRGENLRPEDYMFFDPLIFHGLPEIHDRHRDMRLDVDNMSYEELLALGERIGDVKTGLTEETILKFMKQRTFSFISTRNLVHIEPCCVCQEDYVGGDNLGTLECGHDFHTDCIKQWLTLKNLCPICKATGLIT